MHPSTKGRKANVTWKSKLYTVTPKVYFQFLHCDCSSVHANQIIGHPANKFISSDCRNPILIRAAKSQLAALSQ